MLGPQARARGRVRASGSQTAVGVGRAGPCAADGHTAAHRARGSRYTRYLGNTALPSITGRSETPCGARNAGHLESSLGCLRRNRRARDHGVVRTLYEAVGGADGLLRLASAWHARVMADKVVSHAFSHGYHPEHTARLAAWAEALDGPTTYSQSYGDESSVVRMHSGNGPHEEMDRRAIACFDEALLDVGLARDEQFRAMLHNYFAWATTTTMARYHESADEVPDGLRVPHWSWDGLVSGTFPDDI